MTISSFLLIRRNFCFLFTYVHLTCILLLPIRHLCCHNREECYVSLWMWWTINLSDISTRTYLLCMYNDDVLGIEKYIFHNFKLSIFKASARTMLTMKTVNAQCLVEHYITFIAVRSAERSQPQHLGLLYFPITMLLLNYSVVVKNIFRFDVIYRII